MMFFALCISFAQAVPQPTLEELLNGRNWKPLKTIQDREVGEIVVQEKEVNGFPCFRAKIQTEAALSVLETIVLDIPSQSQWSSAGVTESITLEQSETHIDYYQYLSIPIVSDRHWFLQAQLIKTEESFRFVWQPLKKGKHATLIAKKRKKYAGAVEPIINIGEWKFSQLTSTKNQVQYSICTHPGGYIPKHFRSVGTIKTLPTNVKELILEAKRRVQ